MSKKPPLLLFSPLTGQVYIATRYRTTIKAKNRQVVVASEKYDVTDQFFAVRDQREDWVSKNHPCAEFPGD